MIIFKYHKFIDKRCWRRLTKAKTMFGRVFPAKYQITEDTVKEAKLRAIKFQKYWQSFERKFFKGILKIYSKAKIPNKLICYLNSSPYSMDDYRKGYITISLRHGTPKKVRILVAHEFAHFIFRRYYGDYALKIGYTQRQLENLKEILTVLHKPVLRLEDKGYEVHAVQRMQALKLWRKYHNLERLIEQLDISKI